MARVIVVAMHPRERVREALCERTCELARYLDHVEKAELKSREAGARGLVRCVHAWRARVDLPAILAHHVEEGVLDWTTRSEWRAGGYESRWVVEPHAKRGAPRCEARMRLFPALGGKGTRVELDLAFAFDRSAAGLQALASTLVSSHFRKLVQAASRFIEEH
jgi:hypothetical protein